jgi:hypothetical protein
MSNNIPIYDFFIFNNELGMLEIRLHELYEYVTLFLIAESNLTLSGIPKPFYLKEIIGLDITKKYVESKFLSLM